MKLCGETAPDGPISAMRCDLRERLYNSSERYGDSYLYQGAASETDPERLRRACELYQTAYDEAEDRAVKTSMGYKRAIVLALMEQAECGRGRAGGEGTGQARPRARGGTRELAAPGHARRDRAAGCRRGGRPSQVVRVPRSVLRRLGQSRLEERETLELQLFCAELLLSSELRSPAAFRRGMRPLQYLDKLVKEFPFADQMISFLWRYIDLVVRPSVRPDRRGPPIRFHVARSGVGPVGRAAGVSHARRSGDRILPIAGKGRGVSAARSRPAADPGHDFQGKAFAARRETGRGGPGVPRARPQGDRPLAGGGRTVSARKVDGRGLAVFAAPGRVRPPSAGSAARAAVASRASHPGVDPSSAEMTRYGRIVCCLPRSWTSGRGWHSKSSFTCS